MQAASFWRLAQYNRPEWLWAMAGVIGSALQGAIMPAFAVALSSLIGAFYSLDLGYLKHQTTVWCLVLVGTLHSVLPPQPPVRRLVMCHASLAILACPAIAVTAAARLLHVGQDDGVHESPGTDV